MLPDLRDASFPDVEDDRLAVLERGAPSAFAARGLEHDDMVVACQHVVDLASQRPPALGKETHPGEQLLLPAASSRVQAATGHVPRHVVGEQRIDGRRVVRLERREQASDDLLVCT